ncbi:MAG TPA: DUF2203 domain-containing protein [Candidatus Dormibacteraeota bacterium]
MERVFSESEANGILPELTELLTRLAEMKGQLEAGTSRAGLRASSNGSATAAAGDSRAERAFNDLIGEIEALGVVVRDAESGLVDFAATRDGEPIYLCWRLGEERVGHWHPRDTGFAGRQPL